MNVPLSPDLEAFIQYRIASGRNANEADVFLEALNRLVKTDQDEVELLSALLLGEERAASEGVIAWSPDYMQHRVNEARAAVQRLRDERSGSR